MALSKTEKKKRCVGCRANRYNMGAGYVENPKYDAVVTCDECWHLKTARAANKLVYYSTSDIKPTRRNGTLSCWHNNIGSGTIIK